MLQVETSIGKRIRMMDDFREQLQSLYWSDVGVFRLDMRGCVFA